MATERQSEIHKMSFKNKEYVLSSINCQCFHCLNSYPAIDVVEYAKERDGNATAICPKCWIDAVLPDSLIKLSNDELKEMSMAFFHSGRICSMNAKILIVDDEPVILDLMKEMLSDDYDVDICQDPTQAFQMTMDEVYDVVITDYNMYGVDGATLTNAIHNNCSAKIFIMTGNVDSDELAKLPGVIAVINKPIHIKKVKELINNALNN